MKEINNRQDIIGSRDVMARIDYLEGERETLMSAVLETQESLNEAQKAFNEATDELERQNAMSKVCSIKEDLRVAKCELEDWTGNEEEEIDPSDEAIELKKLKALAEEIGSDVTLIRDGYFEDYARQTAEDLGLISSETQWPATCIDWDAAATELRQDYTSVEFDGEDYYYRE